MDSEVIPSQALSREKVLEFEAALAAYAAENNCALDAESMTSHHFAPGVYIRELRIPAGTCLTGKIHRGAHLNIISAGRIAVLTEHGIVELSAPCTLRSDAGIKRVGFAIEDTVWSCIHANPDDCTDMTKLEARFIAPDFTGIEHTEPDKCLGQQ